MTVYIIDCATWPMVRGSPNDWNGPGRPRTVLEDYISHGIGRNRMWVLYPSQTSVARWPHSALQEFCRDDLMQIAWWHLVNCKNICNIKLQDEHTCVTRRPERNPCLHINKYCKQATCALQEILQDCHMRTARNIARLSLAHRKK